jgi:hypothetical protein
MNLIEHLTRQVAFSRATFGPSERTEGVIDHIRKELVEVEECTTSAERAEEWVDVVILALDGLTRAIRESHRDGTVSDVFDPFEPDSGRIARVATGMILGKQNRNELRDWPDWRTAPADKAIEHTKGKSK